jgi:DNA-binding NarL/FixJ family response regulator
MAERTVRVLLVDDHAVVREGLRSLVDREAGMGVVGEAGSVAEALQRTDEVHPDVVVLDLRLPDGSGIEACRSIREDYPDTRVLILTSFGEEDAVMAAVMAGASGFLLKGAKSAELAAAIRTVAAGESMLDPTVTGAVLARVRKAGPRAMDDELSRLTEQEYRILELIAEGKTNREIAGEIYLSDKTVKNYVSNILEKLGLHRRSEAAAFIARKRAQSN